MAVNADVLVVGAGIIGAACALSLQRRGLQVTLIEATSPGCGVTAAGMGHLVALDETPQELDLCLYSLELWREFFLEFPGVGEAVSCGTLWVAEDEHQLAEAHQRAERLNARNWHAEAVAASQLQQLEPALRSGLAGGIRVRNDSVVYPPAIAHHLTQELVRRGGQLCCGERVLSVGDACLNLESGSRLSAKHVVIAAGNDVSRLIPDVTVFPRKGHLAITDRYPGRLSHQIVSMNYGQSDMSANALAVAANVQPRPTGQWLVGSCRQDGKTDTQIDVAALSAVMKSAISLLPCLAEMRVIRSWAGMRPASLDGRPIIGEHPLRKGVWLAAGHEGLGVTTALATAELLANQIMNTPCAIDVSPYLPSRFPALQQALYV